MKEAVRAPQSSPSPPVSGVIRFSNFEVDTRAGELRRAGIKLKLSAQPFEVLVALLEKPGQVVTREELHDKLWSQDTFVDFEHGLNKAINKVREALGDDADNPRFIETLPRRGYRLLVPVLLPGTDWFLSTESCKIPGAKAGNRRLGLPRPTTSLIGREQEVAEAASLLLRSDVRLLSLTGAGGAGKTRLAIAIASAVADKFPGGVQFVGLAAINHADLVATAIMKTLDVQQAAGRSVAQLFADHLQGLGPFLLVLDNFEQVLPAATVVAEILSACTSLKILVTSRASLRIYGEQEFPVAPLKEEPAVELFSQRATSVRPNFVITSENSAAVRETCARLDGLPLAIELAAARTRVLSPRAILERLQSRLQLLTGGALDLPERQQTLRKAIDWSHDLLNESEQSLFRRFSVFSGGGTLEAAEAVCNTGLDLGIEIFDGLSSLVDKNLVQRADSGGSEARFTMLETIREYALERLVASGEESSVRRAHAAYCLVLAELQN